MTTYLVLLRGEDGMEFSREIEAVSRDRAYADAEEGYPESFVLSVESPDDVREREQRLDRWAQKFCDDPYHYDTYD
jgi:hypothetical protein